MYVRPQKPITYYIPEDAPHIHADFQGKTIVSRELERFWQSIQLLSGQAAEYAAAYRAYHYAARTAQKDKDYWLTRANQAARCLARLRMRENSHIQAIRAVSIQ